MKPIELGRRRNFQHEVVWRELPIFTRGFYSIYNNDRLDEDFVSAIEYAKEGES